MKDLSEIITRFEEVALNERRQDPINRPRVSAQLAEWETERINPVRDIQEHYELSLKVSVHYWAVPLPEPRRRAREVGEASLRDLLYGPVVSRLAHIRSLLDSASSRNQIEEAITELMAELRP